MEKTTRAVVPPDVFERLHADLEALGVRGTLYIGGSVAHGEAHARSDIDAYVLLSTRECIRTFFNRKRIMEKKRERGISQVFFVLPRALSCTGLYFFYGYDARGQSSHAVINASYQAYHSAMSAARSFLRVTETDPDAGYHLGKALMNALWSIQFSTNTEHNPKHVFSIHGLFEKQLDEQLKTILRKKQAGGCVSREEQERVRSVILSACSYLNQTTPSRRTRYVFRALQLFGRGRGALYSGQKKYDTYIYTRLRRALLKEESGEQLRDAPLAAWFMI